MAKSILVIHKKRGRPATGHDPVIAIRLPRELTDRIDEWMKISDAPSRSEAVRRLIEVGLGRPAVSTEKPKKPHRRRDA
jgi:hypothetical protein